MIELCHVPNKIFRIVIVSKRLYFYHFPNDNKLFKQLMFVIITNREFKLLLLHFNSMCQNDKVNND